MASGKDEDVYLNDDGDGLAAGRGLGRWFGSCNEERPHQALGNATPTEWYHAAESHGGQPAQWAAMQRREDHDRSAKARTGPRVEADAVEEF
ncbi:MAG: hypothetical protein IH623_12485 [Verrucomicrobia bacterium]|nr:hypothetical protein [Verrucomicrobiota bacterium]